MVTDITSEKELQAKLEFYATHDPVTALPNQASLFMKLDDLCKENKSSFAVLFLDIDRFQFVNDSLGYQVGEALLQKITSRLIDVCADTCFIARLHSNDFIVVMEHEKKAAVLKLANEIVKRMEEKVIVDDYELHLTIRIGISFFPEDGDNKQSLLETARSALYQAKKRGKNNVQLYSAADDISAYKKYRLESDMRKAIAGEEFEIYYQPQVETSTGIIKSAEALIRWQHAEWGIISPGEFIPLAEENHLIHYITDWMIRRICQQLREWKDMDLTLRPIAINISAVRFFKKGLVELVQEQLELYQISAKYLVFEITESMLLSNEENIHAAIMALKEIGIKIAIDDFGTGFSSLTYLREFPADMIKIDKVFIQSADGKNQRDAAIVSSVLHLAKGLEMEIVAEGVEEHEQLEYLEQKECDFIQGYLFSKPVPAGTFERMMNTGYLRPNKPKINKAPEVERRKYYRFEFPYSVRAEMLITEVNQRKVKLGKAEILLKNISIGGLKILSSLQLPVNSDMKFQFHFVLMGETFIIDGHLIWKNEGKADTFYYGVEFDIQEQDQDSLAKSINAMTTLRKNHQSIPDTDFIEEPPHVYLRK